MCNSRSIVNLMTYDIYMLMCNRKLVITIIEYLLSSHYHNMLSVLYNSEIKSRILSISDLVNMAIS